MAIRLTSASSQYLTRTTNVLNYNADYTFMGWWYLASDKNDYNNFFCIAYSDVEVDAVQTASDGTTLNVWSSSVDTKDQNQNGSGLSTATWYHIAVVRSAGVLTVYLNGVSNCTCTITIGTRTAPSAMWVGSWRGSGDFGNARFFSLKAWTAALTQAEIQAEMYANAPRRAVDLYGWWPTLPGATERLADYSGNAYNWTASASAPTDEDPAPVGWGAKLLAAPLLIAEDDGAISGTSSAVGGTSSTLTGQGALAGSSSATGGTNSSLKGLAPIAGTSNATAATNSTLIGRGALAATNSAQASTNSTLTGSGALASTITAQSGTNSTLTGQGALAGSSAASGTATGTLELPSGEISGTASASTGTNSTLAGSGALAGTITATGSTNSTLTGNGTLAGTTAAQGASNSTLGGIGALTGSSAAVGAVNAILAGVGALAANAAASGGSNSTLTGQGTLGGTSSAVAGSNSTLTDLGSNLSGIASAIANSIAALTGQGALVGTASGYGTAYATEGTAPVAPPGPVILLGMGGGGGPLPVGERPDYQIKYNPKIINLLKQIEEEDDELLLLLD